MGHSPGESQRHSVWYFGHCIEAQDVYVPLVEINLINKVTTIFFELGYIFLPSRLWADDVPSPIWSFLLSFSIRGHFQMLVDTQRLQNVASMVGDFASLVWWPEYQVFYCTLKGLKLWHQITQKIANIVQRSAVHNVDCWCAIFSSHSVQTSLNTWNRLALIVAFLWMLIQQSTISFLGHQLINSCVFHHYEIIQACYWRPRRLPSFLITVFLPRQVSSVHLSPEHPGSGSVHWSASVVEDDRSLQVPIAL